MASLLAANSANASRVTCSCERVTGAAWPTAANNFLPPGLAAIKHDNRSSTVIDGPII